MLFNDYFASKGHNFCAAALHVLPDDLAHALDTVRRTDNICGLCVTIPHKIAAVSLVDRLTEAARQIGSVNFVRRERDGTLTGHNIDGQGFMRGLAASGVSVRGANVVQVGVGGVGRSIAYSLAAAGVAKLTLVNRDFTKAVQLASELAGMTNVVATKSDEAPDLGQTTLLVNATSIGMVGNPGLPLSLKSLTAACAVADVVLKPEDTELLASARNLGCMIMPGTAMLRPQIELCEEFING